MSMVIPRSDARANDEASNVVAPRYPASLLASRIVRSRFSSGEYGRFFGYAPPRDIHRLREHGIAKMPDPYSSHAIKGDVYVRYV
jgi:hypothetical protein